MRAMRLRPILSHRRSLVILALTATLASCMGTQTENQKPRPTQQASAKREPDGSYVRAMQLIDELNGWALTYQRLAHTTDGGRSWVERTATDTDAEDIKGAYFFDASRGWVVADDPSAKRENRFIVSRTVDGGASWRSVTLTSPLQTGGTSAFMNFLTPFQGWLVVGVVSSINFQSGELYETHDGGLSWTNLDIPFAGVVEFSSPSTGWVAGGPTGKLFRTLDGGGSWGTVSPPRGNRAGSSNIVSPTFLTERDGVLPETVLGEDGEVLAIDFRVTKDTGEKWGVAATAQVGDAGVSGGVIPTSILTVVDWISLTPNGGRMVVTEDGGRSFRSVATSGLPTEPIAWVYEIDFATRDLGWAVDRESGCEEFKTDCWDASRLFVTRDGGATWSQLKP
jgi:hypothetical protein